MKVRPGFHGLVYFELGAIIAWNVIALWRVYEGEGLAAYAWSGLSLVFVAQLCWYANYWLIAEPTSRLHRLQHRFKWTFSNLEMWWRNDGELMIGYRCAECGKLEGIHPFYARVGSGKEKA